MLDLAIQEKPRSVVACFSNYHEAASDLIRKFGYQRNILAAR